MEDYTLTDLSLEEQEAIKKDIDTVLEKYNAEIQVTSTIHILKRVESEIPSPYTIDESDSNGKKSDTTPETEKGSESSS